MFLRIAPYTLINSKYIVEAEECVPCGRHATKEDYQVTLTMRDKKLYMVYGDYARKVWAALTENK